MAEPIKKHLSGEGGLVPIPDPTELTTRQLLREIATSREVVEVKITGVQQNLETRLDGMDRAIELLQKSTDQLPNLIASTMLKLQELHEEKFASVQKQFTERDTRTEQTSRDSKVAVDAALKAQQEAFGEQNKSSALAIAKSEAATMKQMDQIGVIISTGTKATDDKIDDLKSRVQAMESAKQGGAEQKHDTSDSRNYLFAIVGMVVGVAGLFIGAAAVVVTIVVAMQHR
jgi:hypothetical protein